MVDDESPDGTLAAARAAAGRRPPRAACSRARRCPPGWVGKSWACWQGVRAARGDWLLFTDADVVHAPDSLGRALAMARRLGRGGLTLFPTIDCEGVAERAGDARGRSPPSAPSSPRGRSRARTAAGSPSPRAATSSCSAALYDAVGGHAAIRTPDGGRRLPGRGRQARRRTCWCRCPPGGWRACGCTTARREVWDGWSKNASFAAVGRPGEGARRAPASPSPPLALAPRRGGRGRRARTGDRPPRGHRPRRRRGDGRAAAPVVVGGADARRATRPPCRWGCSCSRGAAARRRSAAGGARAPSGAGGATRWRAERRRRGDAAQQQVARGVERHGEALGLAPDRRVQAGHAVGVAAGDLLAVGALHLGRRGAPAGRPSSAGGLGRRCAARRPGRSGARRRRRRAHAAAAGALGGHPGALLGQGGALVDQALALLGHLAAPGAPGAGRGRRGPRAAPPSMASRVERRRARRRERSSPGPASPRRTAAMTSASVRCARLPSGRALGGRQAHQRAGRPSPGSTRNAADERPPMQHAPLGRGRGGPARRSAPASRVAAASAASSASRSSSRRATSRASGPSAGDGAARRRAPRRRPLGARRTGRRRARPTTGPRGRPGRRARRAAAAAAGWSSDEQRGRQAGRGAAPRRPARRRPRAAPPGASGSRCRGRARARRRR